MSGRALTVLFVAGVIAVNVLLWRLGFTPWCLVGEWSPWTGCW